MRAIHPDQFPELLKDQALPCVSLYQPTHRHHPDNAQDPIRYRNMLGDMQASLELKYPAQQVQPMLEKFQELERDTDFWNHRTDGLVILASPERFEVFDLQTVVPELVVVADSFHLKPLIRNVQSADRFQVLALTQREAKLYEGNRDALDPVELSAFDSTIDEALGDELTEKHRTVTSHNSRGGKHSGNAPMQHGQGGKKDEVDLDRERFFRAIDRGVSEHYSVPSGLPLILAALPEHHAPFRAVSANKQLMDESLAINPDALKIDDLRQQVWALFEATYQRRLDELLEAFGLNQSRQLGSDDLAEVAQAASQGRVARLLVEAHRQLPGRVDAATGQVQRGELVDPQTDDLLDDLAEMTLRAGGEVVVVPKDRMPTQTGLAAFFRFAA